MTIEWLNDWMPQQFPKIICDRCGHQVPGAGMHLTQFRMGDRNRPVIIVRCHGMAEMVEYTNDPNETVHLWGTGDGTAKFSGKTERAS